MAEKLHEIKDIAGAEAAWRAHIPTETVFDLWEVRLAFHRHFRRPLRFLLGRGMDENTLFLPLSWVAEKGAWCFFPGETWSNKTWLEQNRLRPGLLNREALAAALNADFHLRYIIASDGQLETLCDDETGYLFHPPAYQYDLENWWAGFGRRHAKALCREIAAFRKRGVHIRCGGAGHFNTLAEMNLARFGENSYFADQRFRNGFSDMLFILENRGLLRVTLLYIEDILAAVDVGSVFRNRFTLLAGGTDNRFPGAAKLINLYHLEWACTARLAEVDFLCGDFFWKPLFHLTPRPLYLLKSSVS